LFTGQFNPNPTHDQLIVRDDAPVFSLDGKTYTLTAPGTVSNPGIIIGGPSRGLPSTDSSLTVSNGTLAAVSAKVGVQGLFGPPGAGLLNVSSTARLNLSGLLLLGGDDNERGTLNITNGGDGTMNTAFVGFAAGSKGIANINGAGSTLTAPFVYVGNAGDGTMNVTAGGLVTSWAQSVVGGGIGSTGRVVVDGPGSTWNNTGSLLAVGSGGAGSVTVQSGGLITGVAPKIGSGTGSVGNAFVTGPGSRWTGTGTTRVGEFGSGSLTVSNGGSASFDMSVGDQPGSSGVVTVTGLGSRLTSSSPVIGREGAGTLSVTGGGVVTAILGASIGQNLSGRGNVFVDGAGSELIVANVSDLYVGEHADGSLTISNGGFVSADSVEVPYRINSDGHGFAAVRGANSRLVTVGSLTVGGTTHGGSGSMSIENAGHVTVGTDLIVGNGGTISMNAGQLTAGPFTNNGGFSQTGGTSIVGPVSGASTISLAGGASFTADRIRQNTLILAGNSTATIRPNGSDTGVSVLNDVAIGGTAGAWQGKLDLSDNDLVIDYALSSPMATVIDQLREARNFGAWDGAGITSSAAASHPQGATTLGAMEAAEYFAIHGNGTPFSGQTIDDSSVLVKHTYYGDTDFNGFIDGDDYARADNGINTGLGGWTNGDTDLNGFVDGDDYALIDNAFNTQAGTILRAVDWLSGDDRSLDGMDTPALQRVRDHFATFGVSYAQQFLASVPEPGMVLALPFACSVLSGRRRRASGSCSSFVRRR
jgi:T5SS/PEP-CTERM-associated repeat protein